MSPEKGTFYKGIITMKHRVLGSFVLYSFLRLYDFMECNGSGKYLLSDFTFILGRYSKNDSLENELDRKDFGDMVYPYYKFVDYSDESYAGYKTKEEEEANE